jgi:hypothetical protein
LEVGEKPVVGTTNGMSTSGDTAAFSRRNQAPSENSDDDVNGERSLYKIWRASTKDPMERQAFI